MKCVSTSIWDSMVTIIFESHGTTFDNEADLSSGIFDVELSPLGEKQAQELGERHKGDNFDAIFCSDLQRSYKTAEIAFMGRSMAIIKDARLRECDYGDWTRWPKVEVEADKGNRISTPYPNGQSFEQTTALIKSFLVDLLKNYNNKKVMIIGHRATQYGLENLIKGVPLKQAVMAPRHWQPGWAYSLDNNILKS
ncbi:MAG: histidine phosphatase family protein [Candidatus Kerfeldbacteria bacterium]|nr:histidine phosphatase family protein [Candidatus Kerfeldbacteria bacterium]